jgi:hypothetical protein
MDGGGAEEEEEADTQGAKKKRMPTLGVPGRHLGLSAKQRANVMVERKSQERSGVQARRQQEVQAQALAAARAEAEAEAAERADEEQRVADMQESKMHAKAQRAAQAGHEALARARLNRPESVRWDLCVAAPVGSAAARALPATRGRPLSVFGHRPPSALFPSRPTASVHGTTTTTGDPASEWGFAKADVNPLDLVPLPGASRAADAAPTSAFARRAQERDVRRNDRLKVQQMERMAAESAASDAPVPVSVAWWLCCCFMRGSERRRTGICMPRTGEKAEAALQQRVQTAVRDYKISLSVQRRTDLDERVAPTEARRNAARKQPEKALAPPPRTTSPVNLKPKANLPRSSSGRSKKGSKKGSKEEEQEEDEVRPAAAVVAAAAALGSDHKPHGGDTKSAHGGGEGASGARQQQHGAVGPGGRLPPRTKKARAKPKGRRKVVAAKQEQ